MSRIASSRLLPRISAFSFSTASPAAPAASSSPAAASAAAAASDASATGDPSSPTPPAASRPWAALKFAAFAAVSAVLGTTGYVSYACSLEEVNQMTRELRKNSKRPIPEDVSGFEKFQAMAYSAFLLAAIELYLDVRSQIEDQIRGFSEPVSDKLLPDLAPQDQHVLTLVLDLNETLVYSDWKRERGWRTFKRPGVDAFLEHLGKFYEIVVYSDQLSMYVDPVVDRLDPKGIVRHRLSRVATKYENGKHFRDLSKLNRNPAQVLYISGHALESTLQPENCVSIKPWKLEDDDTQLIDLIPFLEYVAVARPADIRTVLASYQGRDIAAEFIERSKEHQRGCVSLSRQVQASFHRKIACELSLDPETLHLARVEASPWPLPEHSAPGRPCGTAAKPVAMHARAFPACLPSSGGPLPGPSCGGRSSLFPRGSIGRRPPAGRGGATRVHAVDGASAAAAVAAAADAPLPPLQVTWQIVVGAVAGATPFVVAGVEFSKRIIAQKKCEICGGSGLVPKKDYYVRCQGWFSPLAVMEKILHRLSRVIRRLDLPIVLNLPA
ncbi:hypothetical protein EJB05_16902 [Eragrostis curvula]|uniref:Mitochondrial import inner membrane translocase subunit TIM50 n=1 Tax=Eragrostis curvula TaxID=38414 RepID=A0A5J9VHF5_9POAL|nr:hypothetical protein EJB05_16902 [Eragrostis curvula]